MIECETDNNSLIYKCPHCECYLLTVISELACCIFRHGFYNTAQINPHASKEECDQLASDPNVIGCCKPFKIIREQDKYYVTVCEYI